MTPDTTQPTPPVAETATPRTDEAERIYLSSGVPTCCQDTIDAYETARTLETELSAALQRAQKAEAERDEAKALAIREIEGVLEYTNPAFVVRHTSDIYASLALTCAKLNHAAASVPALTAELDSLRKERDEARVDLINLLARIHRDGGHYLSAHGMAKSVDDADEIVAALFTELDAARADSAREKVIVQRFQDQIDACSPETEFWASLNDPRRPQELDGHPHRGEGGATTLIYHGAKLVGVSVMARDPSNFTVLITAAIDAAQKEAP